MPASVSTRCRRLAPRKRAESPAERPAAESPPGTPRNSWSCRSDGGSYALAWRTETRSAADVRLSFVDASSGRMLLGYSTLKPQQAGSSGATARVETVDFRGDAARTAFVIGTGERRTAARGRNGAADGPLQAAEAAVDATRSYFQQRTGHFLLDESDAPVQVIVHPASPADWDRLGPAYARYFGGAFWDGRVVVLGEGTPAGARVDGRTWANAALAADLVAHELAHAVLDRTAGLEYRRESGALAEAFADIVATSVTASIRTRRWKPVSAIRIWWAGPQRPAG